MASYVSSTKYLRKINSNSFQIWKSEEEVTLSKLFSKTSITLLPKPGKDTKRKLQDNITDEYRYKKVGNSTSKPNSTAY